MNDVPPSAAIYVAGLAGCRLPTLDEWNAALLRSRVTGGSQHVNLRDRTWQIEQSYLRALEESGPVRWPDEEAFVPGVLRDSAAGAVVGRDAPSNAWDDHVLWFAPVDRAETRPPFHES